MLNTNKDIQPHSFKIALENELAIKEEPNARDSEKFELSPGEQPRWSVILLNFLKARADICQ